MWKHNNSISDGQHQQELHQQTLNIIEPMQTLNVADIQHNSSNIQQVGYPIHSLVQGQSNGVNMSQPSQLVLLPQNLTIKPEQQHQQMFVANDGSYQIIQQQNNVLVPANLMMTNNGSLVLIPSQSPPHANPQLVSPQQMFLPQQLNQQSGSFVTNSVPLQQQHQQQQLLAPVNFNGAQLMTSGASQEVGDCEYIAVAADQSPTLLTATIPDTSNHQLSPTHQLTLGNNAQIIGILQHNGVEQKLIFQNSVNGENQILLSACIDPYDSNVGYVTSVTELSPTEDINAFLESTFDVVGSEKADPNRAKQWLKDSYIVTRALKALKQSSASIATTTTTDSTSSSSISHHYPRSRPHVNRG